MQSTQQKVRETVKQQQGTVRNLLQLAPVPNDETDCRYCLAAYTALMREISPTCILTAWL